MKTKTGSVAVRVIGSVLAGFLAIGAVSAPTTAEAKDTGWRITAKDTGW